MKQYQIFRLLVFICLLIIAIISTLYLLDIVTNKIFAGANAIVAITAAFLGIFARKPVGKEDMSLAVEKLLLNYEDETFLKLKQAKEEEKNIRDYIENRSNEIVLLKIRKYLVEEIESAYRNSYLSKLIGELEEIEGKLDSMNITYESVKLPERFKEVMRELNEEDRLNFYLEVTSAILPFISRRMIKTIYKLFY